MVGWGGGGEEREGGGERETDREIDRDREGDREKQRQNVFSVCVCVGGWVGACTDHCHAL